jgi:hypothetical protein
MVFKYKNYLHEEQDMFDIQLKLNFHEILWGCMILCIMIQALGLAMMRGGNIPDGFSIMSAGLLGFFISRHAFISSN